VLCDARPMWESDLTRARARHASFDRDTELEAARSRVKRWRPAEGGSTIYHPAPLIARPILRVKGGWLPRLPAYGGELVGLDEHERPLLVLLAAGEEQEWALTLFTWSGDGFEEIDLRSHGPEIHVYGVIDGRVVHRVSGNEGEAEVALVTWDGERAVRLDRSSMQAGGYVAASALAAAFDRDGEIVMIRRAHEVVADDDAEVVEDPASLLPAALARAATLRPSAIAWDGRVERSEPLPDDPWTLVEPLALALADAIARAVADAAHLEPFCVEVTRHHDGPSFPPRIRIAGRARRDRMRAASGHDRQAIVYLGDDGDGDVVSQDLVERLDEPALAACRALSTATRPGADRSSPELLSDVVRALGDRLAGLLHRRAWPGTSDPFLALVETGDHGSGGGQALALRRAVDGAGREHVERFLESITSTARRPDPEQLLQRVEAARTDRAALAGLLRDHGLATHARRIAFEIAETGLQVLPATGADARSRLGGPALLPAGVDWPRHAPGRPLTFLAGVDLAEVRAAGGDRRLPETGWLLFFADLDNDEADGMIDFADNAEGMPARVLHSAVGEPPVEVTPPAELASRPGLLLNERRVRFDACLTLPSDYEAADRLGLDGYEAESYDELREVLLSGQPMIDTLGSAADALDNLLGRSVRRYVQDLDEDEDPGPDPDESVADLDEHDDSEQHVGEGGYLVDSFVVGEDETDMADPAQTAAILEAIAMMGEDPELLEEHARLADGMLGGVKQRPAGSTFGATHWFGGLETGAQGHPPENDRVLLLSLAYDATLGFEYLDGGVIQFRIPADALVERDWSKITAEADSG
jgi:hypothetical protein